MYPPVVTKEPKAVQGEVQATFLALYPEADGDFVACAFDWVVSSFNGEFMGYQAVDARYHDLEHTMQGTLCMTRLLRGRAEAGAQPRLTEREFRLGLLAILLHDTGYLKKREDQSGTGAKYTVTHVARSADFAAELLKTKGYDERDIHSVQNMIRCTGLNARLDCLPFDTMSERITGYALATADLLGQMAADDYVDKLPILYGEFAEAAAFTRDRSHFVSSFQGAQDLIQKTPGFWKELIRPKLDAELLGLWRFLNQPYPEGPNPYMERIEAQMNRISRPGVASSLLDAQRPDR